MAAALQTSQTITIDHPSQQTHIVMGQPGIERKNPDYFPLYVGNHILGGSVLVSRLSEEIREKRGLSYSTYSFFNPMAVNGPYTLGLQTRNDQRKQWWAPTSGEGFEVKLSVTARPQTIVDGKPVTPPCNDYDDGGVSGSSQLVDGVDRETSIGLSHCLDGTELVLSCSVEHTRGYLESGEKDAALALCKSIER
jgi:hypothetical protein